MTRTAARSWLRSPGPARRDTVPNLANLLRDAAGSNPELRPLIEEVHADRLRRMTDNARRFAAAGHLRPGITVAEAANVMWTYSSSELYELLVLRRGMPIKTYGRFVADAMIAALV